MPVDPFGGFTQSLQMAIPLVLRTKALQQEEQQFQAIMGQKKMQLAQENEQERQKIATEEIKNKMTVAQEVLKRSIELKDPNMAQVAADNYEKMSMKLFGTPPLFPRDPNTGKIPFDFKIENELPTRAEMEGEYAKTGDPKILKNLQTLDAAKRSPKDIKTWVSPTGEIKNLRSDQMPPAGYVPYSSKNDVEQKDKELIRIEDDIQQIEQKQASIISGQNITDEALGSGRPEALAMLENRKNKLIEQYKELGGKRKFNNSEAFPKEPEVKESTNKVTKKIKKEFSELPPAVEYANITIKDTKTGKRFKSNGKEWVEVK